MRLLFPLSHSHVFFFFFGCVCMHNHVLRITMVPICSYDLKCEENTHKLVSKKLGADYGHQAQIGQTILMTSPYPTHKSLTTSYQKSLEQFGLVSCELSLTIQVMGVIMKINYNVMIIMFYHHLISLTCNTLQMIDIFKNKEFFFFFST